MDDSKADILVRWYENLEEQISDFMRYVPPQGQNKKTWSPRLATVIVESCGLIDSLLRDISPSRVTIKGETLKRKQLELPHFCTLYNTKYGLATRSLIVLSSPPEYRTPFAGWTAAKAPDWWTTHNKLKHERLKHAREATWGRAIDALAGALVTIAVLPELTQALMRRHWLEVNMNPELILDYARDGFRQNDPIPLITSFFALILCNRPLPANIGDFSPAAHGGSARLIAFFGRY